jgi:YHS domain-containing protein
MNSFIKKISFFIALSTSVLGIESSFAQSQRNVAEYNLTSVNVGLKGYDPVSYFAEGGQQRAQIGKNEYRTNYQGVTYFFANQTNLDAFLAKPEKYEPTYGGWCAYAMSYGSKVDIDPNIYTIKGNRAHFFVSVRAKRNFDVEIDAREVTADKNWFNFSGEAPRK